MTAAITIFGQDYTDMMLVNVPPTQKDESSRSDHEVVESPLTGVTGDIRHLRLLHSEFLFSVQCSPNSSFLIGQAGRDVTRALLGHNCHTSQFIPSQAGWLVRMTKSPSGMCCAM